MLKDKKVCATLPVADLDRAVKFYTEKVGLDIKRKDEWSFMVGVGNGSCMHFYLKEGGSKADHTQATFLVDNVEAEAEELSGNGVVFEQYDLPEMGIKTNEAGIAEMGNMKAAWFKDTEGNIISISEI